MRKILFFFCIPLLMIAVIARGNVPEKGGREASYPYIIKGIITDEHNAPLPGASVKVLGTSFGAGSDSQGEFIIRMENTTQRTLNVSFVGYQPQEITITPSLSPAPLYIRLQPSSNQLNEVVVTGTFIEKPLKEVPVLTRIITQKEIQALNPMSIENLLQYELPGLQIGYNSMSQLPEITYQGMGGEYILFLIDGERVSGEGADHNVDFTRFNIDDIERIEVIKGSQSTLYGSNALGGVINIITKTADRPFTGNLSARYAGTDGQKYTVSAGARKNRLTSYTSLTWRQRDTYCIEDGGESSETGGVRSSTVYGYNIWNVSQKLGYTCNEHLSVDLKGSFYHNQRDLMAGKLYQDYFIDYSVGGKIKYLPREGQQLTLSYTYDNYKKDKDYLKSDKRSTDYRNITQTPRLDYTGKFGNHTVSIGFEGNMEYLKHYMLKDSSHVANKAYSFYIQEDWQLHEQLNLIIGLRSDYHEKYHLHLTPKLSALWHPAPWLTLRGGYSQGFRSPSLKELYQEYDMGGLGIMMLYGNPDLQPETSHQYSLSAEFTQGGLNVSVSASHNRFHHKIALLPLNDGTRNQRYENADRSRTTGIESIVRYSFGQGIVLTGSYAYTDDYQEIDGKNTSFVRPHSVTFNAMYHRKFGQVGINCSLNGQWYSRLETYSFSSTKDDYTLFSFDPRLVCSLNMGATLPRGISLNLGIDNLLNHKDKAADSSIQVPQRGISLVGTLQINLADMWKL